MSRALVLGGGGVAGIGWETGVLLGLLEGGLDALAADVFIGTSAGAAVGAQVTSGTSLTALFDNQRSGAAAANELAVTFDPEQMMRDLLPRLEGLAPGQAMRAAVGRYAAEAGTVPEPARRAVIEGRLPVHDWPASDLRIVAVEALTGEPMVFTAGSGVSLVDAVTASCAVPGVWPPATINGASYIDGGIRSSTNLDLALGCDRVLVLAPVGDLAPLPPEITRAVDAVRERARLLTIRPDVDSLAAMGQNPLDPTTAAPAAVAGRVQGLALAATAHQIWE